MINLEKVTPSPTLERSPIKFEDLSDVGKEVMERGHGEAKGRYGHDLSDRESFIPFLDPRLVNVPHYSAAEKVRGKLKLQEEYVKFCMVADEHRKQKTQKRIKIKQEAAGEVDNEESESMIGGCDSDSDVEEDPEADHKRRKEDLQRAFKSAFKHWRRKEVDWRALYPDHDFGDTPNSKLQPGQLRTLDMKVVFDHLRVANSDGMYGRLIEMGQCYLPGNNSASFVERQQSYAKNAMTDKRTQLSEIELEMLVVLRINRNFMEYMKKHFQHLIKAKETEPMPSASTSVTTDLTASSSESPATPEESQALYRDRLSVVAPTPPPAAAV